MNEQVVPLHLTNTEPLKVGDKVFKSAYDWSLADKDLEKAARELGETEEKKREGLRKLKEKLSKDSNIKYRYDDAYLLRFLRVRKYDVKKAYQNVKHVFEERKKHVDFFILPPDLKSILELRWSTVLPYQDEEGRIIFWINFNRWKPEERTFEEMAQATTAISDIVALNPTYQINGGVGIWNLEGLSMKHVSELLWNGRISTSLAILQNGYPWRIKKIIVFNTNRVVRFLYNLLRPVLSKKIADRMILIGSDVNELHQHVDRCILPKDLNGALEDDDCDVSPHVLNNLPYLKYERSFIFE